MLQYFIVIERVKDKIKDIYLFEILKAFLIGNYYDTILFSERLEDKVKDICLFQILKVFFICNYYITIIR